MINLTLVIETTNCLFFIVRYFCFCSFCFVFVCVIFHLFCYPYSFIHSLSMTLSFFNFVNRLSFFPFFNYVCDFIMLFLIKLQFSTTMINQKDSSSAFRPWSDKGKKTFDGGFTSAIRESTTSEGNVNIIEHSLKIKPKAAITKMQKTPVYKPISTA